MRVNMLTFRNHEATTGCIVLNLLKTENQRSGVAREERVTVKPITSAKRNEH